MNSTRFSAKELPGGWSAELRGDQMPLLVADSGAQSSHLRIERPIEVRSQFRADQVSSGDDRLYSARKVLTILDDVVKLLNRISWSIVWVHVAWEILMSAVREGGREILGHED